jgi:hypothetical protein
MHTYLHMCIHTFNWTTHGNIIRPSLQQCVGGSWLLFCSKGQKVKNKCSKLWSRNEARSGCLRLHGQGDQIGQIIFDI